MSQSTNECNFLPNCVQNNVITLQNPLSGGIGKVDSEHVDPLHTFLGLAGLSLVKYKGLNLMNPMLTTSNNASEHLSNLHRQWNTSGLN